MGRGCSRDGNVGPLWVCIMRRATLFRTTITSAFLLLVFLVLGNSQTAQAQTPLPACQQELGLDLVFPSPQYNEDDTIFWINQSENSLWRSQDNGETWLQVFKFTSSPLYPAKIEQFQMTPHSADRGLTLYLGVNDIFHRQYHLYRSEQTGDGWEERVASCSSFDDDCISYSLRAAGQTPILFQPRWWMYGWSPLPFGVARSDDGGMTWQMVWEETHVWKVAVSPDYDNDQTLWATLMSNSPTLGTAFILSRDGGATWQAAGQGMCDDMFLYSDFVVSPGYTRNGALLMGLYQNSLFQSKDGGLTWQAIFPRGTTAVCDSSLTELGRYYPRFAPGYPDDPTIYVAATRAGLYASYDDGQSWRRLTVSGTVFSLEVAAQAEASTIEVAGASEPVSDAMAAVNSSTLLHQVFLPRVGAPGSPTPVRPYSLFMRAYVAGTIDAYMYRSDDGGATWQCMEKPQVRRRTYLPLLTKE